LRIEAADITIIYSLAKLNIEPEPGLNASAKDKDKGRGRVENPEEEKPTCTLVC
jgi:hypothetical protein